MTEPTNHTVTIYTHFGNNVTAPVIYVKDLGDKRALVHVETNYHIVVTTAPPTPRAAAKLSAKTT